MNTRQPGGENPQGVYFRLLFAYTLCMGRPPHDRTVDLQRLGGALVTGASVILAIRTARREPVYDLRDSNRDWDQEIHFAVDLTAALLSYAIAQHAELFRQTAVTFTDGIVEEDIMK